LALVLSAGLSVAAIAAVGFTLTTEDVTVGLTVAEQILEEQFHIDLPF
jgi:hypothetical protein